MATPYRAFQFGLLPERQINWQTLATVWDRGQFILLLVNIGLLSRKECR